MNRKFLNVATWPILRLAFTLKALSCIFGMILCDKALARLTSDGSRAVSSNGDFSNNGDMLNYGDFSGGVVSGH